LFFVPFIFGKNGKSYNVAAPEQRSEVETIGAGVRALTAQGGMKMTRAEAVAAVAEQVTPLAEHRQPTKEEEENKPTGSRLKIYGSTKEYRTAKLARDAPKIVERMKTGEFRSVAVAERAAASPCSAAFRYQWTASASSCGTPLPSVYVTPRLYCIVRRQVSVRNQGTAAPNVAFRRRGHGDA